MNPWFLWSVVSNTARYFLRIDISLQLILSFKTVNCFTDSDISSFNASHPLQTGFSSLVSPPMHPLSHPRDYDSSLGVASVVSPPSANAPISTPSLLQCLFFICQSLAPMCRRLVGHRSHVFWPTFHHHGRPVKFARCSEAWARREAVSR